MNIVVTGGAGYLGTIIVRQLLFKEYKVRVLDNLMFGGNQLMPFFSNPNFAFQKGDVRSSEDVKKAMRNMDVIIHLAAIVGYPACRKDPDLAVSVNVGGTKNVISALEKDQLILFGSTGSNYGAVKGICTEDSPLNPLSVYGKTKVEAECDILEAHDNSIAYRFATAFGVSPRLRLDLLINDFTYKSVSQGYVVVYESHFMRTFMHVLDFARAFLFGIENADKMSGQVFNVGSDQMNYSKKEMCKIIEAKTGSYFHYADIGEDADKRNYVVSYEKINNLGFSTTITVEEGIEELIRALEAVEFNSPYSNA